MFVVVGCPAINLERSQEVSIPLSITPAIEKLNHQQTIVIAINSEQWKNAEIEWSISSSELQALGELSSSTESTIVYKAPATGKGTVTIAVAGRTKSLLGFASVTFTVENNTPPLLTNESYSESVRITDDDTDEYVPSYSPNQSSIVFMSNQTGNWQIYSSQAYTLTSSNKWERLTNNSGDDFHPRFSPDGTKIIFSSNRSSDREIYVLDLNTKDLKQLTSSPGQDTYASYSYDGQHIVFMSDRGGNSGIYLMKTDGSEQHPIIDTSFVEAYPSISPDGKSVVFQSNSTGNYEIYSISIQGGEPYQLTDHLARDAQPVFTPDGNRIVFETNREGAHQIYVMNVDGTNLLKLTDFSPSSSQVPFVSPDGEWVIFQSELYGSWDIFRTPLIR